MNKEIVVKEDQLPTELLDEITASAGEGTVSYTHLRAHET